MNVVLNKYLPERSSHSRLQVSNSPIFRSLQPIKQLYCESKYLLLLSEKNQFWSTNREGRLLFDKTQSHNNMDFIILHIWSLWSFKRSSCISSKIKMRRFWQRLWLWSEVVVVEREKYAWVLKAGLWFHPNLEIEYGQQTNNLCHLLALFHLSLRTHAYLLLRNFQTHRCKYFYVFMRKMFVSIKNQGEASTHVSSVTSFNVDFKSLFYWQNMLNSTLWLLSICPV